MKTLLTLISLMAASFLAHSQSATNLTLRCIISLDDGSRATNIVNISGTRLAGLIEGWKLDTTNKVNAKAPALTLGQYVFQEVKDKGAEWERAGALNELKAAGFTNTAVTPSQKLLDKWATLTPTQQSRVVEYLNSVAE